MFDQYGIKEVANVTIFSVHRRNDGSGDIYYMPALYLDTLKISNVEKTAEETWAEGGKGNQKYITWDYGKSIKLTLQDALCTPASLSLCWGGVLNSKWKNNKVEIESAFNDITRVSRMEKGFYPHSDGQKNKIVDMLPHLEEDSTIGVFKSSILDNLSIFRFGYVDNNSYKQQMVVDSESKSIFTIPDRFFTKSGKYFPIKNTKTIGIVQPSESFKYEIILLRNSNSTNEKISGISIYNRIYEQDIVPISHLSKKEEYDCLHKEKDFPYLKIRINNNGSIRTFLGSKDITWNGKQQVGMSDHKYQWVEITEINTYQFKQFNLWKKFDSLNLLTYYILTQHEDDIAPTQESQYLWAYINPMTMQPYDDDYWFTQGEPYYKYSLSFVPHNDEVCSLDITSGQFPGLYKIVGETYIRGKGGTDDKKIRFSLPLCKIKSNQTFNLSADGEPTVFDLEVEALTNKNKILMDLTFFKVEQSIKKKKGRNILFDGSTQISTKNL